MKNNSAGVFYSIRFIDGMGFLIGPSKRLYFYFFLVFVVINLKGILEDSEDFLYIANSVVMIVFLMYLVKNIKTPRFSYKNRELRRNGKLILSKNDNVEIDVSFRLVMYEKHRTEIESTLTLILPSGCRMVIFSTNDEIDMEIVIKTLNRRNKDVTIPGYEKYLIEKKEFSKKRIENVKNSKKMTLYAIVFMALFLLIGAILDL